MLFDLRDLRLVDAVGDVALDELGGAGGFEVVVAGALLPVLVKGLAADAVLLGPPRMERRDLRRRGRGLAAAFELGFDLGAAAAERLEQRLGQSVDLADAAADGGEAQAEASDELGAQLRLVEVAAGLSVGVQAPSVERGPAPVGSARHVRHEDVGVQLGVAGAARAVAEGGAEEAVAEQGDGAALAAATHRRVALHVAQRRLDGGVVGVAHRAADVV